MDLKTNIERKVLGDYAKPKYMAKKGSTSPLRQPARRLSKSSQTRLMDATTHLVARKAKHLRTRTVKDGTVLPAKFAIIDRNPRDHHNPFPAKQQRAKRSDDRQRQAPRHDSGFEAQEIYDRFGNQGNIDEFKRKINSRGREAGLIAYATTVDSGSTRHAAFQEFWLKEIRPYASAIIVGGKKEIIIRGIGDVIHEVADTTGSKRMLEFRDVLYVPDMKFNIMSIAQILKKGTRLVFSSTRCTFFVGKD
ncbi:hypothetical protein PR003_g18984 [Phytophthora rubi]|uniref:Retrovirus-related Pol polyprotein from transposon TNT 1-94-like beta-barrel domain-containing protein n=1 Tax=Phytophthora rubi TaxID=129364 RepID=A0A6A3MVL7_9STRA|nr:hypothetical protein PR001_g10160 [Phytophthora rubi]KAE9315467.1 hypothetical protein PR003_g18984 [Phytophthora rubi]